MEGKGEEGKQKTPHSDDDISFGMTSNSNITMEPFTFLTFFFHKIGQGPASLHACGCYPEASQTLRKGLVSLPPDFQNLFPLTFQMSGPLRTTSSISRPVVPSRSKLYVCTLRKGHKPHTRGSKGL